jgi:hypothetical protein
MMLVPRQGAVRGALLALVIGLALPPGSGCRAAAAAPLAHTLDSPEALARAVLAALAARDEGRLQALALSEPEFRSRVWPELPASRPERNLPLAYVWGGLKQKSDQNLRTTLSTLGGQFFDLRGVEFTGGTTRYRTFTVSRSAELIVADATGAERRIRAFGSVVRADGRVKVFSYVTD